MARTQHRIGSALSQSGAWDKLPSIRFKMKNYSSPFLRSRAVDRVVDDAGAELEEEGLVAVVGRDGHVLGVRVELGRVAVAVEVGHVGRRDVLGAERGPVAV